MQPTHQPANLDPGLPLPPHPLQANLRLLVSAWAQEGAALPVAVVVSVFDDILELRGSSPVPIGQLALEDVLIDPSGIARLGTAGVPTARQIADLLRETLCGGAGDAAIPPGAMTLLGRVEEDEAIGRPLDLEHLRGRLRDDLSPPAARHEVQECLRVLPAARAPQRLAPSPASELGSGHAWAAEIPSSASVEAESPLPTPELVEDSGDLAPLDAEVLASEIETQRPKPAAEESVDTLRPAVAAASTPPVEVGDPSTGPDDREQAIAPAAEPRSRAGAPVLDAPPAAVSSDAGQLGLDPAGAMAEPVDADRLDAEDASGAIGRPSETVRRRQAGRVARLDRGSQQIPLPYDDLPSSLPPTSADAAAVAITPDEAPANEAAAVDAAPDTLRPAPAPDTLRPVPAEEPDDALDAAAAPAEDTLRPSPAEAAPDTLRPAPAASTARVSKAPSSSAARVRVAPASKVSSSRAQRVRAAGSKAAARGRVARSKVSSGAARVRAVASKASSSSAAQVATAPASSSVAAVPETSTPAPASEASRGASAPDTQRPAPAMSSDPSSVPDTLRPAPAGETPEVAGHDAGAGLPAELSPMADSAPVVRVESMDPGTLSADPFEDLKTEQACASGIAGVALMSVDDPPADAVAPTAVSPVDVSSSSRPEELGAPPAVFEDGATGAAPTAADAAQSEPMDAVELAPTHVPSAEGAVPGDWAKEIAPQRAAAPAEPKNAQPVVVDAPEPEEPALEDAPSLLPRVRVSSRSRRRPVALVTAPQARVRDLISTEDSASAISLPTDRVGKLWMILVCAGLVAGALIYALGLF